MKSLEIVNETYEYAYDKKNDCYPFFKREVEIIKQDLEVLEIIRKKKVDICYLIHSFKMYEDIEKTLMYYNHERTPNELLTLEELLKLKQWLEGNEDDNKSL